MLAKPCPPLGVQVETSNNPVSEWLSDSCWGAVTALREIEEYAHLPEELVGSSKRWRDWVELERPEDEPLPGLYGWGWCILKAWA